MTSFSISMAFTGDVWIMVNNAAILIAISFRLAMVYAVRLVHMHCQYMYQCSNHHDDEERKVKDVP